MRNDPGHLLARSRSSLPLDKPDDISARFETWIAQSSAAIPDPQERRAFLQFATWQHLRVLRQHDAQIRSTQADARRSELNEVLQILSWVQGRSGSLSNLTQSHVDQWLSEGPVTRRKIRPFLSWARRNHYCTRLWVPLIPRSELNLAGTDETGRWNLLTQTLNASSVDPRTRFAAALILLYGIRASRIVQLRTQDIFRVVGTVHVALGSEPLALPPAIGEIASLALATREAARMFGSVDDDHWLIPGTRPGYPISPVSLGLRLKSLGIMPGHARAGALASLSGQLPPVILSKLTGLEISSAIRWSDAVSASNARYAVVPHLPTES